MLPNVVISFAFPDETVDLHIKLIDNPAVHSWADHFLKSPQTVTSHIVANIVPHTHDSNKVSELVNHIRTTLNKLSSLGYRYLDVHESVEHVDRAWFNRLHRFFTHTQQAVNLGVFSKEVSTELTTWLQQLNDAVHTLEDFWPPDIGYTPDFSFDEIYCSDEPVYNHPGWWQIDPAHRQYHSAQPATVILGSQILGKTLLRSYLDNDDPRDWDTSGHYCSNGALLIQVSDFRSRVYNSNDFYKWLARYNLTADQVVYDFPIGHAIDPSQLQLIYDKLSQGGHITTTYKYES